MHCAVVVFVLEQHKQRIVTFEAVLNGKQSLGGARLACEEEGTKGRHDSAHVRQRGAAFAQLKTWLTLLCLFLTRFVSPLWDWGGPSKEEVLLNERFDYVGKYNGRYASQNGSVAAVHLLLQVSFCWRVQLTFTIFVFWQQLWGKSKCHGQRRGWALWGIL